MNYSYSHLPMGNKHKDIYSRQIIIQMHHQTHQRTLQPNINITKKYNSLNVPHAELINNTEYQKEGTKKKKYHRHQYIMQNISNNKFKIYNNNNPLSESEHEIPLNNIIAITFIQEENLSTSNNSRFRAKFHPSRPIKVCHKVIYSGTVYKLVSN